MPEAPMTRHEAALQHIEALYRPTHDEYARQRFDRRHAPFTFPQSAGGREQGYETKVAPALKPPASHCRPTGMRSTRFMQENDLYRFYSTIATTRKR